MNDPIHDRRLTESSTLQFLIGVPCLPALYNHIWLFGIKHLTMSLNCPRCSKRFLERLVQKNKTEQKTLHQEAKSRKEIDNHHLTTNIPFGTPAIFHSSNSTFYFKSNPCFKMFYFVKLTQNFKNKDSEYLTCISRQKIIIKK